MLQPIGDRVIVEVKEVEEQTGINRRTFRRYRSRYNVTVDKRKNNEKRDS